MSKLTSVIDAPTNVLAAFNAVRRVFPTLLTVAYDSEQRWLFQLEDGSAPNFRGTPVPIDALEAAADSLTATEVCWYDYKVSLEVALTKLWQGLSNVKTEADGSLAEPFLFFQSRTPREDVWRWFEEQHPEFSVARGGFLNAATESAKLSGHCQLHNELQPDMKVDLPEASSLVMTYASDLRVVDETGNETVRLREIPSVIVVNPCQRQLRLSLHLWHGRPSPETDMDDWGYDTDTVEGYPGDLTGDAFIITKDGVTAVNYLEDGSRTSVMLHFHGDVLKYGGEHYWGDFSISHVKVEAV